MIIVNQKFRRNTKIKCINATKIFWIKKIRIKCREELKSCQDLCTYTRTSYFLAIEVYCLSTFGQRKYRRHTSVNNLSSK